MFCKKCGEERVGTAQYCVHCGCLDFSAKKRARALDPKAIWNPNAAANWSLVFTPAFGSYLHMRNWQTLDRPQEAAKAKAWFYASIAVLMAYLLVALVMRDEKATDGLLRAVGMGFLIAWYFSTGREQAKYVSATLGKDYPRRPWGTALLVALAGWAGYFAVALAVGFVFALVKLRV